MKPSLLHNEYEAVCRGELQNPYSYRSFLCHYNKAANNYKATLRIRRKPGEIVEVDWTRFTSFIIDRDIGKKVKAMFSSRHSYAVNYLSRGNFKYGIAFMDYRT